MVLVAIEFDALNRHFVCLAAKKAQEVGVKRYVEVSTAFVYKSQVKQPAKEDADLQPWTLQAKYKLEAEEEIRRLPDLKAVFLRLATVCH